MSSSRAGHRDKCFYYLTRLEWKRFEHLSLKPREGRTGAQTGLGRNPRKELEVRFYILLCFTLTRKGNCSYKMNLDCNLVLIRLVAREVVHTRPFKEQGNKTWA